MFLDEKEISIEVVSDSRGGERVEELNRVLGIINEKLGTVIHRNVFVKCPNGCDKYFKVPTNEFYDILPMAMSDGHCPNCNTSFLRDELLWGMQSKRVFRGRIA